jgi:hypothetical protein
MRRKRRTEITPGGQLDLPALDPLPEIPAPPLPDFTLPEIKLDPLPDFSLDIPEITLDPLPDIFGPPRPKRRKRPRRT